MKTILWLGTMLVFGSAVGAGQGDLDPLTRIPVIPAAETVVQGKSYGFQPTQMPVTTVCKSKMSGNFYAVGSMNVKDNKIKMSTVVSWYAAHLSGFTKTQGYESGRSQIAFSNGDGSIVVFLTGEPGPQSQDTTIHGIGYESFQPGISEKTIAGLTQGKVVCP